MNSDKFKDFVRFLVQRSGRSDWPEPSSEYWRDFRRQLGDLEAGFDEADEAIRRACNRPSMFINDFRPFILAEIPRIREERRRSHSATPAVPMATPPPLPPRPDGPENLIQTPADLKRFCSSLAGSFSARRAIYQAPRREASHGQASGLPGRSERHELAAAITDPVVKRELAHSTPGQVQDDLGWF